jgi:hypothetical protein
MGRMAAKSANYLTKLAARGKHAANKPAWWSGKWGHCVAASASCEKLGVANNLCGACAKIPGGFMLYNKGGLRFNGMCVCVCLCVCVCV